MTAPKIVPYFEIIKEKNIDGIPRLVVNMHRNNHTMEIYRVDGKKKHAAMTIELERLSKVMRGWAEDFGVELEVNV